MKRTLLGLVAVAALGATLVSTGAFVDTVENTSEKIEMEPSDGPNAVYAVEDSEGEIKLDLSESNQALAGEGINEGSLTKIPNIFTVNYSTAADEPAAEVWFTTDAGEGVEFVVGTDSVDSIDGNDSKRTLPPDEKLHIGVIVDTRGEHDVESVSSFTIHVERPESTESSGSQDSDGSGLTVEETEETAGDGTDDEGAEQDEESEAGDGETEQGEETDESGGDGSDQDTGDTETEDGGEEESEAPDTGDPDQNETSNDSGQDPGDGADGDGGVQSNDDGGLQTTGQQPSFPGPEETLGGFLSGSFLWLLVAVLGGSALFAATRYGTDRFWGGV